MRLVINFLSLLLVVVALMLLGADLITSLEHRGQPTARSIEDVWALLAPSSLDAFKAWAHASLPGFLAQVVYWLINLWSWAVTGVIGVILAFVFGRHHHEAA